MIVIGPRTAYCPFLDPFGHRCGPLYQFGGYCYLKTNSYCDIPDWDISALDASHRLEQSIDARSAASVFYVDVVVGGAS